LGGIAPRPPRRCPSKAPSRPQDATGRAKTTRKSSRGPGLVLRGLRRPGGQPGLAGLAAPRQGWVPATGAGCPPRGRGWVPCPGPGWPPRARGGCPTPGARGGCPTPGQGWVPGHRGRGVSQGRPRAVLSASEPPPRGPRRRECPLKAPSRLYNASGRVRTAGESSKGPECVLEPARGLKNHFGFLRPIWRRPPGCGQARVGRPPATGPWPCPRPRPLPLAPTPGPYPWPLPLAPTPGPWPPATSPYPWPLPRPAPGVVLARRAAADLSSPRRPVAWVGLSTASTDPVSRRAARGGAGGACCPTPPREAGGLSRRLSGGCGGFLGGAGPKISERQFTN
jgi:hypothetical protein